MEHLRPKPALSIEEFLVVGGISSRSAHDVRNKSFVKVDEYLKTIKRIEHDKVNGKNCNCKL